MENYIVRIYRLKKNDRSKVVGLVEEVGKEGRRGFTNYDELWAILNDGKDAEGHSAWPTTSNDRIKRSKI